MLIIARSRKETNYLLFIVDKVPFGTRKVLPALIVPVDKLLTFIILVTVVLNLFAILDNVSPDSTT